MNNTNPRIITDFSALPKPQPTEGDLRFWWIPQMSHPGFHYPVKTVQEALLLYRFTAQYDLFLLEQRHRPDFSNMGGLEVFRNGEWEEWESEDEECGTLSDIDNNTP